VSLSTLAGLAGLGAWGWLLALRGDFWRVEAPPPAPEPAGWPEVVAVIPARDEAACIGGTVATLLSQDYPGTLSVVVVDDHSSDGTADRARAAAAAIGASDRLTVVAAPDLPPGWAGKMWAQNHGIATARALRPGLDLLLLTDADIDHAPSELRRQVARLLAARLDMASLMVRLPTDGVWERAVVPAFVFFFRMLYPFAWVSDASRTTAAAAGGYVLIRPQALDDIGGVAAIRDALIDDCTLAAAVKRAGWRIQLDLARDTASSRRYSGPSGLWKMISRSAYAQLNHSPLLLAGTVAAMLLVFVAPPVLVLTGGPAALFGLIAWAAMSLAYAPMVRAYGLPPGWSVALPLVALFYLGATIDSAVQYWRGRGGAWKGRVQDHRRGAKS